MRGQAFGEALHPGKVKQLCEYIKQYSLNIINLQEAHITKHTFDTSDYISQNYDTIINNSPMQFGTCVLVSTAI